MLKADLNGRSNMRRWNKDFWQKLFPWKRGDRVRVVNPKSPHFGKKGTVYNFFTAYPTFDCGVSFDSTHYEYFKRSSLERIPNEDKY